MASSKLPGIGTYLPEKGKVFRTSLEHSLPGISEDLCCIVSYLQEQSESQELNRYHDWWEHDEMHFPAGSIDFHKLTRLIDSPRSLVEAMTQEHRVFEAIAPSDRKWYLRFLAEWDEDDAELVGEYSLTLAVEHCPAFEAEVVPKLRCGIDCEADVVAYFLRIA